MNLGPFGAKSRLRELDGWRAISVLLVIAYHLSVRYSSVAVHIPYVLGHVLKCAGALGVKVFFVISGFVICRLLISEERQFGSISLRGFYYRRVFRIVPPFYAYLAVISLLMVCQVARTDRTSIVTAALFLFDLSRAPYNWLVAHTWSLAVEEQFYLTFPTAFLLLPAKWRWRVFAAVFVVFVSANLVSTLAGWSFYLFPGIWAGFSCISCGVLLAIREGPSRRWTARTPAIVVAMAGAVLLARPVHNQTWASAVFDGLFTPLAIGLILLFSLDRGPWLKAFLCSAPVQAIGLTSYGVYLWQQLFTAPASFLSGFGQFIPNMAPILLIIVPVSYVLLEKPAMRYGRSLSQRVRRNDSARAVTLSSDPVLP